jgi:GAF domain-containing protein
VPQYFTAAKTGKVIAAADAYADPRTAEFGKVGYLPAFGVGALLDAPVFSGRTLLGVLCHEHVGNARAWEPWEELIATALGDCAGIVLSVVERPAARASGDR